MELKIIGPVKEENPKNVFELHFEVEHGDADGSGNEVWNFEENEKEDLITVLEAFAKMLKSERGYEDVNYPEIPGFKELMEQDWPQDHTAGDYYPATLVPGYKVFYFNNEGVKHDVKIIK